MMKQFEWYLRYALEWARFAIETNPITMAASTICTRVWAYYWVLAAAFKYRNRRGKEGEWNLAKDIIERAIHITILRGKREVREEERRFWRRVVELAEQSGKPQWVLRDMLEEWPWLIDMPLRPEATPKGKAI